MGKYFTFQLSGAPELMDALDELPNAISKKVLADAGKVALQPVLDAAVAIAAHSPQPRKGTYEKSFQIGTKLSRGQEAAEKKSGERGDVNIYVGSTDRKAHLLEFGHQMRGGKGRARMFPVLRPAWDENRQKVLDIFGKQIWAQLAAAARRLNKKAQKNSLSTKQAKGIYFGG